MQATRRAVLEAVADGPVPGPALAERLDVSRAAVWKHVEALREAGFDVESGDAGYELVGSPEFGGPTIEFGLDAPFEIEYHDSVPSTNDRARELASEGCEDVAVVADVQTGGRGRLDREWASPSGGVWLSVLLRPDVPPAKAPAYTLAAAVATTRAVREVGVDAGIKWPNDVLVRDTSGGSPKRSSDGGSAREATRTAERKLAGVLTEMEGEADRVSWLVVGVGVNADVDGDALPAGATSLREQVGDVDRRAFVQQLLTELDSLRGDVGGVLSAWREHAITLGRRVRVETPAGEVVGEAVDVTAPGALIVETADGRVEITAGDCEHLRAE